MKSFEVSDDIEIIRELLNLTIQEFAEKISVAPATLHRWKNNDGQISPQNLEKIYDFAFNKRIYLNKIKEQLYREERLSNHAVLFHGAKTYIDGELSLEKSKGSNDFGKGFYCGESLEQAAMFVAGYPMSSLYIVDFDKSGLTYAQLRVDQTWMLLIAYFRGKLDMYKSHPLIQEALSQLDHVDYIVAPIADNRMFEIIDSFIDGEITDVQCQHCLSATNLGNQYVFTTQKALDQVKILRHCYLAQAEKKAYLSQKSSESKVSNDKVKIARRQYRGQGLYIEDILK